MSTSTVDTSDIDGDVKTGPTLLTELILQLENAKADLEARPTESAAETIPGNWIFTGQPVFRTPSGTIQSMGYFENMNIEGGHTNPNALRLFGTSNGAHIKWQPYIDGVSTGTKEAGFDFELEQWFVETELLINGNTAWHAGNFDPTELVPDSLKTNGRVYKHLEVLTGAAGVAVDATTQSAYFLANDQAMTLTFTWPAASADADLGANFKTSGEINIRNTTGHGTLTLAHASAVTDSEEIGTRGTGATEMYTLKWECWVIGASRYVQFTWVAA
jgi:hypothetical protein